MVVHFGICHSINEKKYQGYNPVIAEIKVFSPMYGDLLGTRGPMDILRMYEECGASGISYITAPQFRGSLSMLERICTSSNLPVLRKDFVSSESQINETATAGASALLLISRNLGDSLESFVGMTEDAGLEPVVEVHSIEEMESALDTSASVILINNRDITRFETDCGDVSVTEKLAPLARDNVKLVSASGIVTCDDVKRALSCTDAVLIGTSLMRSSDMRNTLKMFVGCE